MWTEFRSMQLNSFFRVNFYVTKKTAGSQNADLLPSPNLDVEARLAELTRKFSAALEQQLQGGAIELITKTSCCESGAQTPRLQPDHQE